MNDQIPRQQPLTELMSPREAMSLLRCSYNHLRTLPIPIVRLGRLVRYRTSDVAAFINNQIKGDAK